MFFFHGLLQLCSPYNNHCPCYRLVVVIIVFIIITWRHVCGQFCTESIAKSEKLSLYASIEDMLD